MSKVCRHVIDRRVRRKLLNGSVLSVSWITSTGLPLPLLRAAASGSEKGFPSYTQEKKMPGQHKRKEMGDGAVAGEGELMGERVPRREDDR